MNFKNYTIIEQIYQKSEIMDVKSAMQWRYSTKVYDIDKKIDSAKIEELKEVLRLCPSSVNSQPWRFTFVRDSVVRHKLSEVSYFNSEKIRDCNLLVVFSRIDDIEKQERWMKDNLPEGSNTYYENFVKKGTPEQIKAWFSNQLYISLGVFLEACAQMEIDSTPMEGLDGDKYDEILNLSGYHTMFAVAIGYRSKDDYNQPDKVEKSRREANNMIYSI